MDSRSFKIQRRFKISDTEKVRSWDLLRQLKQKRESKIKCEYSLKDSFKKNNILKKHVSSRIEILESIKAKLNDFRSNLMEKLDLERGKIENDISEYKKLIELEYLSHSQINKVEEIIKNNVKINEDIKYPVVQDLEGFSSQEFYKKNEDILPALYDFHLNNSGEVMCIRLSEDNKYVFLGCKDSIIRKLKIRSSKETLLYGHLDEVRSLVLYDNYLISGSLDSKIIYWNFKSNKPKMCISNASPVRFLTLDLRSNTLLCLDISNVMKIYNLKSKEMIKYINILYPIRTIHIGINSQLFMHSTENQLFIYKDYLNKFNETPDELLENVSGFTLSMTSNFIFVCRRKEDIINENGEFRQENNISKIWNSLNILEKYNLNPLSLEDSHDLESHINKIFLILIDQEKKLLLFWDSKLSIIDTANFKIIENITFDSILHKNIYFLKRNLCLIETVASQFFFFDLYKSAFIGKLNKHNVYIKMMISLKNNCIFCRSADRTIFSWNLISSKKTSDLTNNLYENMILSENGNYIAMETVLQEIFVFKIENNGEKINKLYRFDNINTSRACNFSINSYGNLISVFQRELKNLSQKKHIQKKEDRYRLIVYNLKSRNEYLRLDYQENDSNFMFFSDNSYFLFVAYIERQHGATIDIISLLTKNKVNSINLCTDFHNKIITLNEDHSILIIRKYLGDEYYLEFLEKYKNRNKVA